MYSTRKYIIQFAIIFIALVFAVQLFFIQVLDTEYKIAAESNVVDKIIEKPVRGTVTDRKGNLIVENVAVFDLFYVPKELIIEDTTEFCRLFRLTKSEFVAKVQKIKHLKGYQPYKPALFIKHMAQKDFAVIADRLNDYPGMYHEVTTLRRYPHSSFANALGYVKEVDKDILERDTTEYYQQGDLIGRTGIEASYEDELRGKRGIKYVMVNVKNVVKGAFLNGKMDEEPVVGENLISSIDLELQQYGELLMANKIGSVVALEPSTGEILAMISAPSYNPNLLTGNGKEVSENFYQLVKNRLTPLYNRTTMAPYPPGSTIKPLQALIALQEGIIDSVETRIPCVQNVVKCHGHPSPLGVQGSIQHSCNPFYHRVYNRFITQGISSDYTKDTRIGLEKWHKYMLQFGLGRKLGTDLDIEKAGNVPSVAYYDKKFRNQRWKFGNIYSLSIGQGEMGVTPLQMANVAAILANRGHYFIPHIIKQVGDRKTIDSAFTVKHQIAIKKEYFELIANGMADVVRAGTARKAHIPNLVVCGKTGTAQNPHGEDHSIFIGFAPKYNPKIAIAVYIENAGFGGTWAAPIASLMIEKYLLHEIKRLKLEETILNKDFVNPKKEKIELALNDKNKDKKGEKITKKPSTRTDAVLASKKEYSVSKKKSTAAPATVANE